jgi:hypothetical protein
VSREIFLRQIFHHAPLFLYMNAEFAFDAESGFSQKVQAYLPQLWQAGRAGGYIL